MKNLIFLSLVSVFTFSCKPINTVENLPKPLPERPDNNAGTGSLSKEESQEMEALKAEITALANSEKCTNPADWKTVGLGVKACGGHVSYIAYSNKIDEKTFLEKVNLYNQKSTEYNKKYNLVSDCMLVMQPENIACENDQPVFK
ncbi:hypothetical protein [Epilithonimonas sp. UC225_85]|uniref:hypothetical protein n=1 Tax=Epilithonimonas sp. UC225_85 TaxID=3350167 RepID=UPI0036D413D8